MNQEVMNHMGVEEPTARAVFLAWEKLRVVYNLVLVVVVVLAGNQHFSKDDFWFYLLSGAVGANVLYCVGPVVEGYLALLGARRREMREVLFILGTLLAAVLAWWAVVFWNLDLG